MFFDKLHSTDIDEQMVSENKKGLLRKQTQGKRAKLSYEGNIVAGKLNYFVLLYKKRKIGI